MNQEVQSQPQDPDDPLRLERTRTSTLWVAVAVGLVLALFMLVFVAQNGEKVQWHFLWIDFTLGGGLAMLFAAVTGGLVVILVGAGRLLQVRLAARRHRRSDLSRDRAATT
ncbi:MAG: DUF1049 domain-containing protein [Actinobacteria bacterium]|nr:DUF1049 domain-containing protein [Actinomycetota bacterium]